MARLTTILVAVAATFAGALPATAQTLATAATTTISTFNATPQAGVWVQARDQTGKVAAEWCVAPFRHDTHVLLFRAGVTVSVRDRNCGGRVRATKAFAATFLGRGPELRYMFGLKTSVRYARGVYTIATR